MRVKLDRGDWTFIAVCIALTLLCSLVIARWFDDAFPEASIDFRYDRNSSRAVAERLLTKQKLGFDGMKHTVVFDSDDTARIFLERSLGLEEANKILRRDVRAWVWRHRWYRPLQEEELSVDVAPTGEIVSMARTLPEAKALPLIAPAAARAVAERFVAGVADIRRLDLVSESERKLPNRIQRIFTWESRDIRPAGATYRHTVTVDGDAVSSYAQRLKVPEQWERSYGELRSKNTAAGGVDLVFMAITLLAALIVFIVRLRRGDMSIRFLIGVAIAALVLGVGVAANSLPSVLASYDTTSSYAAFIGQFAFLSVMQTFGSAMLLVVICGAGEVLYRERLPRQLAVPRIFSRRALRSKRIFRSLVLGYSLVAFFIAYQVVFYIVAAKFGAWSPADTPYDNILNTAIPWVAVLFAGFFPSMSEEFLSRAFSIPFLQGVFRSRIAAIVLSGFIWGFGHAAYPNQPFYIRGVEVGLAGVLLGFLMDRFGIVALLVWHYTVDAVYTALLLFQSNNTYYITSGAITSLIFAIPLIASIALYLRNGGFEPDEELSNAALPLAPPPEPEPAPPPAPLPPATMLTRGRLLVAAVAVLIAIVAFAFRPVSTRDVVDYRIGKEEAKSIAAAHLRALRQPIPVKVAAAPVSAFRSWEKDSPREDGGAPGDFDDVAATYMRREGMSIERLVHVMRGEVPAATWTVRFFTPGVKTEFFAEVDPRTSRVIGYHKYADEKAAGARLDRDAALPIALAAFRTYGVDAAAFDMKEALSFQQPNRRDWLFHFEQRAPLIGAARRRVSVRVMGSEVTQFATTVRVPESVYRQAQERTVVNVVLMVVKVAGAVTALAMVIAGFILSIRHGGIRWRALIRPILLLSLIPLLVAALRFDQNLFRYNTSIAWNTFMVQVATTLVMLAGIQIVGMVVAVVGITLTFPAAGRLLAPDGRARFGRTAAVAAITAIALFVILGIALQRLPLAFPSIASVDEVSIPAGLDASVPSLLGVLNAILEAVLFSGAVALFVSATSGWKPLVRNLAIPAILFAILIETQVSIRELPLEAAAAALVAIAVWLIARFVLGANTLAWPLLVFTSALFSSGAALLRNHNPALETHGWILVAIGVGAMVWAVGAKRVSQEYDPSSV